MIDIQTKMALSLIDARINEAIDSLIIKRDSSVGDTKREYRRVVRKLQNMLAPLHEAQDEGNQETKAEANIRAL